MFRIITVSREYGCGGAMIAETLAKRLGWKLVDTSLAVEAAKRAQIKPEIAARFDECLDPWFHRLVKALWRGGYEGVASTVSVEAFDSDAMAKVGEEVIREAASLGECVIVGRGSQCMLRHREGVFHVRIYGPREQKIARLRQRLASGTDVERVMAETDRRRAAYIRRYFNEDWKDSRLYHLMISSALGVDAVVAAIISAAGLQGP